MNALLHFHGPFGCGVPQVGENPVADVLAFADVEQLLLFIKKIISATRFGQFLDIIHSQMLVQILIPS